MATASGLRGHKLLTKELMAKIPALYQTDGSDDLIAYARFFSPWNGWSWYVIEFDGTDICFGYVMGFDNEFGYFSLEELDNTFVFGNVPAIERDLGFEPTPMRDIYKKKENNV